MERLDHSWQWLSDLTTKGTGVHLDALALVYRRPRIDHAVPGRVWHTQIGAANAIFRFPDQERWNRNIMIGATPAERSEYSLDLLLGDYALSRGYAYAACDKGTPGLTLRDAARQISEWTLHYRALTEAAIEAVEQLYGETPKRTFIAGVSNGGYVVRAMLEQYPELFDGGVDWEGALWTKGTRHLLTTLSTYVDAYPILMNWRGDCTESERHKARDLLLEAGLQPESSPHWGVYMSMYWVVSLWLYGHNLDPEWGPFQAPWNQAWLNDPSPLSGYPWRERAELLNERIEGFQNTGNISKPLLSVAGNWDCLVPYAFHAVAYSDLVRAQGAGKWHRLYEIDHGNHVDALLVKNRNRQEPVLPYFEAALRYLEQWADHGCEPPASGRFGHIRRFAGDMDLFALGAQNDV